MGNITKVQLTKVNNRLLAIQLTSKDIEDIMSGRKLKFYPDEMMSERIEFKLKLPMFTEQFHNYVEYFQTIPTQQEYYTYYIEQTNVIKDFELTLEDVDGLLYHIFNKSYPSLVRELHACLLIKESNLFDSVAWDLEVDSQGKIDVLGRIGEILYGIHLFVDTKNSKTMIKWKNEKDQLQYTNVKEFDLPLCLQDSAVFGNTKLYDVRHLKLLRDHLYKRE